MVDVKGLLERKHTEDSMLEAKRAVGGLPQSIWETYSAFANTRGGIILLGVEELPDKTLRVRGVPDAEEMVLEFWEQAGNPSRLRKNILQREQVYVQQVEGRSIIVIEIPAVPPQERPVYIGEDMFSGTYLRIGEADCRCTKGQVRRMLRERRQAGR